MSASHRAQPKMRFTSWRPAMRASMSAFGGVDVEARAGGGREVEALVQRHRAVVAGADRHPGAIQDLGDVVRVDARHVERDHAAADRASIGP